MTLQQLQYFRVLAQLQHYTRASEALNISQPSLSYAISELERELGVKLFERGGKRIVLSAGGKLFLEYVESALDSIERGKNRLQQFAGEQKNSVGVGYIFSLAPFVQRIIREFTAESGNGEIQFRHVPQHSNNYVLDALVAGKIDVVFCTKPTVNTVNVKIFEQELNFVVSSRHPLAQREGPVQLSEIIREPMIMPSGSTSLHTTITEFFERLKATPNIAHEAEECNAAAAYVSMGYGFTIIPRLPGFDSSSTKVIAVEGCHVMRPIYMCWRKEKVGNENVERFRAFVGEMCLSPAEIETND